MPRNSSPPRVLSMIGTQYFPTTSSAMSLSTSGDFRSPCRKITTDSATLLLEATLFSSKMSSSSTSATLSSRSSWLTVVERLASSRMVFPRRLSDTRGSLRSCSHTGLTRGIRRWWPEGHVAAMFTQSSTAASSSSRCSLANSWKTRLKRSASRPKSARTASAASWELKAKSPRKLLAAVARSEPPPSTRSTVLVTTPRSMAPRTKNALARSDSLPGLRRVLMLASASLLSRWLSSGSHTKSTRPSRLSISS
mmetsp:Transcript_82818/g.231563  ORF Transcript_82818/g.231563 Transcript_82818/m.231563 type:complete len:252 (-) Transcript_82818:178-933(-)